MDLSRINHVKPIKAGGPSVRRDHNVVTHSRVEDGSWCSMMTIILSHEAGRGMRGDHIVVAAIGPCARCDHFLATAWFWLICFTFCALIRAQIEQIRIDLIRKVSS